MIRGWLMVRNVILKLHGMDDNTPDEWENAHLYSLEQKNKILSEDYEIPQGYNKI